MAVLAIIAACAFCSSLAAGGRWRELWAVTFRQHSLTCFRIAVL
jgi:hypothetical protein